LRALKLRVSGVVQGVGFRPFVFRIAAKAGVGGYVRNLGGSGVEIHVEGEHTKTEVFLSLFHKLKPEKIRIDEMVVEETKPLNLTTFKILSSESAMFFSSIIPPDFALCEECLHEVLDPKDRRYLYPFNSCVNCGPRYSMLYRVPYDRENTSMADFPLCQSCVEEFTDEENVRRFHAQGISCPMCGPSVTLYDGGRSRVAEGIEAVREGSKLIEEGFIVAVKGIGGYHIAASATDDDVVGKLRLRKNRPTKPFAVMVLDEEVAGRLVHLTPIAVELLKSPERPIVLVDKLEGGQVSELVAPGLRRLGILTPYTALHHLILMWTGDKFAIMTSGNPYNEPMCIDDDDAFSRLSSLADFFLTHNRRIHNRVDDSVLRLTGDRVVMVRRGRGYAPSWFTLPYQSRRTVIAFGAMLQTAGAVAFSDKVVLTSFVGDLDEYRTFLDLEKTMAYFIKMYKISQRESVLVSDLHPLYPSTSLAEKWAATFGAELIKVQHHWAHVAAVLAECGVDEEVVGIAVDGVGLGTDGNVWGGEVLKATLDGFTRVGYLKPQKMLGGDLAVHYPVRMLAGVLSDELCADEVAEILHELKLDELGFRRGREEARLVLNQLDKQWPLTSSAGRIFDAASAMLGFCLKRTYEGEPAIVLEDRSKPCGDRLDVKFSSMDNYVVDTTKLFLDSIERMRNGGDRREIGYMFQHAVGYGLGCIAKSVAGRRKFLVVSGGAAVNEYFLQGVMEAVVDSGLTVLLPRKSPPNDGGIALGQAAIAAHRYMER
jgi:hydrogenase maturation protein HypF